MAYCEVLVLTPEPNNPVIDLTPYPYKICTSEKGYVLSVRDIIEQVKCFDPAIIHIFNHPDWAETAAKLRSFFPEKKIILDIKTPLLREGESRKQIQELGNTRQTSVDWIFALAYESLLTWIPNFQGNWSHYPLGIDANLFSRELKPVQQFPKRFVYIGSINKVRRLGDLIAAFAIFYREENCGQTLDIFGSGARGDEEWLVSLVAQEGMEGIIRYRGLLPQDQLMKQLGQYEVGLAWVPSEKFNTSPSLKLLEYMMAGLGVVATATAAHRAMCDAGFSFQLAQDNTKEFAAALAAFQRGWNVFSGSSQQKNHERARAFDYDQIFKNMLLPRYRSLVQRHESPIVSNANSHQERLVLVLVIESLYAGRGGAEKIAVLLAEEMARRGHKVYLAYLGKAAPMYAVSKNVLLLPYVDTGDLRQQVITISPDAYFVFYYNEALLKYYSVVHGTGIPFGMQECTNPDRLIGKNWRKGEFGIGGAAFEREVVAAQAARIRLVMPSYVGSFRPYIRQQVRGFPNACERVRLDVRIPAEFANRRFVLNVNGFKPNKGLDLVAKAFRNVADLYPEWDLVIIGKEPRQTSGYDQNILKILARLVEQGRVLILPSRDDISDIFSAAEMHVIGSSSEGCPTVVLEAMAAGKPSIGLASCPGTNELIRHKKNGLLVSGDDLEVGMTQALGLLMGSEKTRKEYGAQAASDALNFEPKVVYDQWEKLFFEAAQYKANDLLFQEQCTLDRERAGSARRMILHLLQKNKIRAGAE